MKLFKKKNVINRNEIIIKYLIKLTKCILLYNL